MPFNEQIPGERYRPGERIRAYLFSVEEGARGVFLRLSRAHPKFMEKLFEMEVPELQTGVVKIRAIAREPGGRTKIAIESTDPRIDPIGTLVGQRGVRVNTVMSELGGERIDIIEWSENAAQFIEESLSPAQVLSVTLDETARRATVEVTADQQSLAIGRGGQNVRLAAKLTGWKVDIKGIKGEEITSTDGETVETDEQHIVMKDGFEKDEIENDEDTSAVEENVEEVAEKE
jgi:N utilization substance protein A